MPLIEYECKECGAVSEILVRSSKARPRCTSCGSRKLQKQWSAFAAQSKAGPAENACCPTCPSERSCDKGTCPISK